MKKHLHKWYMCANPAGEIYALCRDIRCHGKDLKRHEIEARLNENETLKADKRLLMHVVHGRAMASSLPKHLKEE